MMHANFSNFLMDEYRGKQLSHEPKTHENRSEARVMQCYRSVGDSESPEQIVFIIFLCFFSCVLGGLMHKLV